MSWYYAKHSSKDQESDFLHTAKSNPLLFSSQMEANLFFQKKKGKCCCYTHKLMVTLNLLQIPHAEAFKEITKFPYHEHLPAPEDKKKKQLLET